MRDRYSNTPIKQVEGKRLRRTTIYPEVPSSLEDIYVISTLGDRFDILATHYYGSSDYWWIIASNNPGVDRSALTITPGVQIRIPLPLEKALELYKRVNLNR